MSKRSWWRIYDFWRRRRLAVRNPEDDVIAMNRNARYLKCSRFLVQGWSLVNLYSDWSATFDMANKESWGLHVEGWRLPQLYTDLKATIEIKLEDEIGGRENFNLEVNSWSEYRTSWVYTSNFGWGTDTFLQKLEIQLTTHYIPKLKFLGTSKISCQFSSSIWEYEVTGDLTRKFESLTSPNPKTYASQRFPQLCSSNKTHATQLQSKQILNPNHHLHTFVITNAKRIFQSSHRPYRHLAIILTFHFVFPALQSIFHVSSDSLWPVHRSSELVYDQVDTWTEFRNSVQSSRARSVRRYGFDIMFSRVIIYTSRQ